MAHLIDDKTVAKMGHPAVLVDDLFPTFPPLSTPICTTPAPCPSPLPRLLSNDALLLTSKPCRNLTNFAPFRENPQQKPPFFAPPGHLPPINTGIRTANTTCCALYLTDPTEGVTFTTATPAEPFASLSKIHSVHLIFIAPLPPTPSPAGINHAAPNAEKPSQKSGPDSPNDVSQKL